MRGIVARGGIQVGSAITHGEKLMAGDRASSINSQDLVLPSFQVIMDSAEASLRAPACSGMKEHGAFYRSIKISGNRRIVMKSCA